MENNTPNTDNFLNWVEIKNFKSIKDLRLDCKRVNVFIGKPNVGKSNILEGLGLLGAGYGIDKFVGGFVRYESIPDLFYDRDVSQAIQIYTNQDSVALAKPAVFIVENSDFAFEYYKGHSDGARLIALSNALETDDSQRDLNYLRNNAWHFNLTIKGIVSSLSGQGGYTTKYRPGYVKKYDFNGETKFNESSFNFLMPPSGRNLFSVVDRNEALKNEFGKLFIEQNLELVLSKYEQSFELQKRDGFYSSKYPFFSIADTFRRFMFYITAIESNKNSVIIFEEPEVHSFPPYTQDVAYRMIYDEDNQYFISTHSPYMLHPFIEKMDYKDLNVFITYYKDYQTHVRALTEEELTDILDYSTNVFFNLNKFEPDA